MGSVLGAAMLAQISLAQSEESTVAADDMRSELAALKARVEAQDRQIDQLLEQSGEQWLTQRRAEDIRALVHDVLADADTRASLLNSGITAGWDNNFFLSSADGNFLLQVLGEFQFRFDYNHQEDSPDDDTRYGFENTRTRLKFTGHVVNPKWVYMIAGDFDRSGGAFSLLDAYIGYVPGNGWTFLAGQFRVPMLREFLVTEVNQLAIERSLVHQEFTAGRTQGVAADWRGDIFHVVAGFTDGHPATGGFNTPALVTNTDYALTARGEALLKGEWSQFSEFTSYRGDELGIMVGAAGHYQMGESGTPADELEVFQWTVDASAEFGGANLFAYFVGRHLDSSLLSLDQYGFVLQGGWFFNETWELFARYEWGDDDLTSEDLSVVTAGVNKYFSKQQLKWSADVGVGLNEVTTTWGSGFIGSGGSIAAWRTDSPGSDTQIVIRTQMQLLF
jgi:hypothetical protein